MTQEQGSAATEAVLYEASEGVAVLRLNRPERLNAWNADMRRDFFAGVERAAADPAVKVIVITGVGRGFCAGADMELLQSISDETGPRRVPLRLPTELLEVPKPVISAINGPCAGVGFVIATMSDLRFATRGAKMTVTFPRIGLVAEHGLSWVLPRRIGLGPAFDILVSGRIFLSDEAHLMGFVDRLYDAKDLMHETLAYARSMALTCSPTAMAMIKRQIYRHANMAFAPSIKEAVLEIEELLGGDDYREGIASLRQKRPPAFAPLALKRIKPFD
jgi:enoyl-CoA hydratase/carnithine racemase